MALVVMGESLGLPLPGETLLLLGTASAGAGYLEVWGVIVAATGGAIVGDTLGYELGRWGGRPLLERYGVPGASARKYTVRWHACLAYRTFYCKNSGLELLLSLS